MSPSNRSSQTRKSSAPAKEPVATPESQPVTVPPSETPETAAESVKVAGEMSPESQILGVNESHNGAKTMASVSSPDVVSPVASIPDAVSPGSGTSETVASEESQAPLESVATPLRHHPIPPPSEPRQYRAVGLVQGRYHPEDEQFTRGSLLTTKGETIDAVLLGRVMSLVKNHLDLNQEHLWVVYPRTRQQDDHLHLQIMGVWEPDTLHKDEPETSVESAETDSGESPAPPWPDPQSGYFSIRGEVIYQSQAEEDAYVITKIRQAPRKSGDKMKFFKLKLQGGVSEKAVGNFWDFQVQLEDQNLVIQESTKVGPVYTKKRKPFKKGPGGSKKPYRQGGDYKAQTREVPERKEPVGKPIKRNKPNS